MTFILSFPMAHPCWVLAGGFLSSHVGVGHGQTGPVEHLGWGLGAGLGAGTLCHVQMCPDVGEPLTHTSCLLAVGPARGGGKSQGHL